VPRKRGVDGASWRGYVRSRKNPDRPRGLADVVGRGKGTSADPEPVQKGEVQRELPAGEDVGVHAGNVRGEAVGVVSHEAKKARQRSIVSLQGERKAGRKMKEGISVGQMSLVVGKGGA